MNGDIHKVYKIFNLLFTLLKKYNGKELRALLRMDMRLLLHKKRIIEPQIAQPAKPPAKKPTAPPSDSEEDSDDEGGLFDDILGGGGH